MRRSFWVLSIMLVISLFGFSKVSSAKVYARPSQESTVGSPVDQVLQENERTKELLEIWKDHVRTVTKERDEAYKQIEALKSQSGVSTQANAQELVAAADTAKEESLRQIDFLKDKMALLQKKYEDLQSQNQKLQTTLSQNEENRISEAQLAALQAKADKLPVVEKEFQEARDYFSSYMKELDAKNKKTLDENAVLKSEIQSARADRQKQTELDQKLSQLKSENERLQQIQTQQSKTIKTLKSTIQSSLDSLNSNCGETNK